MSKQNDDFKAVVESRSIEEQIKHLISDKIPGEIEFVGVLRSNIKTMLSRSRMHFAGSDPWPDGDEALRATADHMKANIYACLCNSLACGIVVGKNKEYQKKESEEYYELFGKDLVFRLSCAAQTAGITSDEEMMLSLRDALESSVQGVGQMMSFKEKTGIATLHIWDLWNAALGSSCLTLYTIGFELGVKWSEEEILNGILEASEEGS